MLLSKIVQDIIKLVTMLCVKQTEKEKGGGDVYCA